MARAAIVAVVPFLFAPPAPDAAPAPSDPPQTQVAQPRRDVENRAALSPYYFAPVQADAPAPPSDQTLQPTPYQPRALARSVAAYAPALYPPQDPGGPSQAYALVQAQQPNRAAKGRPGPSYFAPPAPDAAAAPSSVPEVSGWQPSRIQRPRPFGGRFAPFDVVVPPEDVRALVQAPQVPARARSEIHSLPYFFPPVEAGSPPCPGGITKVGSTVRFQNNLCALNGLGYTAFEMSLAFPSDIVEVAPGVFVFHVHVQNGDGVGTETTTWADTDSVFLWDDGFTYSVSAIGRINRHTNWGEIFDGANGESIGYNGVVAKFGAFTQITGNARLGGCKLRNKQAGLAGRVFITPSVAGGVQKVVDCEVHSNNHQVQIGSQIIEQLIDSRVVSFGPGLTAIGSLQANDMRGVKAYAPNADRIVSGSTSGAKVGGLRLIGPANVMDIRNTGSTAYGIDTIYSKENRQTNLPQTLSQLITCILKVTKNGGQLVAGCKVDVYEQWVNADTGPQLVQVVDAVTDADGIAEFQAETFGGVILTGDVARRKIEVRGIRNVGPGITTDSTYLTPFIIVVNADSGVAGFLPKTLIVDPPYEAYTVDGFSERQYRQIQMSIELDSPAGTVDQPYFGDSDILAMLEIEGQDVSVGAETTKGILRRFTEEVLAGMFDTPILGTGVVTTIKTGSLSGLAIGVSLSTDGIAYLVREFRQIGDGALTEVLLAES